MPLMGPEDKNGAAVCGTPDVPKPTTGPEDMKGVEGRGAAGEGNTGLPGTFAGLSFPMGCMFS